MAVYQDFSTNANEDGALTMSMTPPVTVSGWSVRYTESKRFGSASGLIVRHLASGFNGVSGITIIDGAQGRISVRLTAGDSSGRDFGNYAYRIERVDSGYRSVLSEGYRSITP